MAACKSDVEDAMEKLVIGCWLVKMEVACDDWKDQVRDRRSEE
jgi:hypothetical protein